jgi:uncharacterized phiE125 gp8 family phage protein
MRPVLSRTEAPAALLSLPALKARLRVSHSDDDTTLAAMLAAAVDFLDGPTAYLGRCIGAQTWTERLHRFPTAGGISLSVTPVRSITSVTYYDADGAEQTIDGADLELITNESEAVLFALDGWPDSLDTRRQFPITITAACGWTTPPAALIEAVCQHVATLYEVQAPIGAASEMLPLGYDDLVNRYRRISA